MQSAPTSIHRDKLRTTVINVFYSLLFIFSSPEPSSRRLCVHGSVPACVCALTLSNMNISATSWPIGMKFYLKRLWGGGKASVGFDPGRIRTLVSMATDSSHRLIMGKTASSRFLKFF